ncbi:MAG: hypothetical protein LC746_15520, partial [Acidobacteria bacterium]|nr:hypothetical protein [Acidobacteriota bacterium]
NAAAADSLSSACVGCVTDAQINSVAASKLTGTIPASSLPAGGSFIQNSTALQANADFNISGNGIVGGNFGVGAASPASKLDVRGHLLLDPGASPILYTSSAAGEQNRFLQLINSPTTPSASGLKAGGVLVADSYSFANPGKNTLIVAGNVGINTPAPAAKLHIVGSAFSPSILVDRSLGATTPGAAFQVRTSFRGTTFTDFIVDSFGFVGVGTDTPAVKLHVSGGAAAFEGNVGIGTTTPTSTSKLEIAAQDGLRITGFQPFLTLRDTNAANRSAFVQGVNGSLVLLTNSRQSMVLKDNGHVSLKVLEIQGGADLAESFEVENAEAAAAAGGGGEIKPGLLVSIDPARAGRLIVSSRAYDRRVAGVISGAGGINAGMVMGQNGAAADGNRPVALSGRVYCWADASNGPIRPGDLLTTSSRPGYAMRVTNNRRARGAIVGKAMTGLKSGSGMVLVLVTLL